MTLRRKSTKLGSPTFMAAVILTVGLHAVAPGAYAEEMVATEAKGDFIPGADPSRTAPRLHFSPLIRFSQNLIVSGARDQAPRDWRR